MDDLVKENIMEAIVKIKASHNKANAQRICNYVEKKIKVTSDRTLKSLQHLAKSGIIVPTASSDPTDISYKLTENLPLCSVDGTPFIQGNFLQKVFYELILRNEKYLKNGIPPDEICALVVEKQPHLSKETVIDYLKYEHIKQNIDKYDNGNYGYKSSDSVSEGENSSDSETKKLSAGESNKRSKKKGKTYDIKKTTFDDFAAHNKKLKKRKFYNYESNKLSAPKDFKVDVTLERQARKRKEKKIFDPSNYELEPKRKNNRTNSQELSETNSSSGYNQNKDNSSRFKFMKFTSPPKKSPPNGEKIPSVIPPGGRIPSITPTVSNAVCYICQSYGKRVKGVPEKVIMCTKCTNVRVHMSCLDSSRNTSEKCASASTWTCKNCSQNCVYCNEPKKGVSLLQCVQCKSAFHVSCHRSLVPRNCLASSNESPSTFKCVKCSPPREAENKTEYPSDKEKIKLKPYIKPKAVTATTKAVNKSTVVAPSSSSSKPIVPISTQSSSFMRDPYENYPIDESIPDVTKWNTFEVYEYSKKFLEPDLCRALFDHEIDGSSVLALQKCDVKRCMNLVLGDALKLSAFVKMLRIRRSDPECFWE